MSIGRSPHNGDDERAEALAADARDAALATSKSRSAGARAPARAWTKVLRDGAVLFALLAGVGVAIGSFGRHDLAAQQTVGLQSRAYRSEHELQDAQQHSMTQCAPKNAPGEVHRCDDDARETDFARRLRRHGE